MRVLVCDDQQGFCDLLSADLIAAGHEVVIANDGWEGLIALGSQEFQAAIIDIDMPRLNGLDLVRLTSNNNSEVAKKTKLIVCTSHDGEWNRAIAWANNAIATISKPYKLQDLLKLIGA
jgi:DNA-binding response OmpR family regulator